MQPHTSYFCGTSDGYLISLPKDEVFLCGLDFSVSLMVRFLQYCSRTDSSTVTAFTLRAVNLLLSKHSTNSRVFVFGFKSYRKETKRNSSNQLEH